MRIPRLPGGVPSEITAVLGLLGFTTAQDGQRRSKKMAQDSPIRSQDCPIILRLSAQNGPRRPSWRALDGVSAQQQQPRRSDRQPPNLGPLSSWHASFGALLPGSSAPVIRAASSRCDDDDESVPPRWLRGPRWLASCARRRRPDEIEIPRAARARERHRRDGPRWPRGPEMAAEGARGGRGGPLLE